ncbi:hypothetical protein ACP275_10G170600 [Erythranthe tilingii]
MVKYQRKNMYTQFKKSKEYMVDEDEEPGPTRFGLICGNNGYFNRRGANPKFLCFVFLSLVSCSLILAPLFLSCDSNFILHSFGPNREGLGPETDVCSSVPNGTICCDRSSTRSDICIMRGDIRTHSTFSSITLYQSDQPSGGISDGGGDEAAIHHERIRPYTRKWEKQMMETVDELHLTVKRHSTPHDRCDVHHDVHAVFFSTGGYTGNLYHEFNDGILPLYITSQHLNKKVVFVILEYHDWWITKYGDILSQLSDFPPIDFNKDKRVHCFPEATIGLKIHNELTIDSSFMEGNKTIGDFHDLLDRAYWPRISGLIEDEKREEIVEIAKKNQDLRKPKLVIVSRNGSREITNEDSLVKMAENIGFVVEVLRPQRTTELAKIYRVLNSSDVVIGVHGAAMTHFLFMKPGSFFIQVVPLGTDWAAETYYGDPAVRFGLRYVGYKILPRESSLYERYSRNDPVLVDPDSVNRKGWEYTKRIYLDGQNVRLDLGRFRKKLLRGYYYSVAKKNGRLRSKVAVTNSHLY